MPEHKPRIPRGPQTSLTIQLPVALRDRLDQMSERHNVSVGWIVRRMIETGTVPFEQERQVQS